MSPKVTDEYKQIVSEKILATASSLFARNGYHATSMDDIVKESGLSKGAIYGYFKSKEDLFLELSDKQLALTVEHMRAGFSPLDSAVNKLEKAAEIHFMQINDPNDVWRVTLELWVDSPRIPSLEKRVVKRYELAHKFLANIIEEGKRSGEFKKDTDADAVSSILLATVRGIAIHNNMGHKFNWQKIKASLLEVLFDGILADKMHTAKNRG